MNPFYWFLVFVAVVWGSVLWFARGILGAVSKQAAAHARKFAPAYAKGGALIAIAVFTSYGETFERLSPDIAKYLSWWSWLALFIKPVIAGLAVYVAFVDRTIQRINTEAEADKTKPTPTP